MNYMLLLVEECWKSAIKVLDNDGNRFSVQSSDCTRQYTVEYAGSGDCDDVRIWRCTCPATKTCKHIKQVAAIVTRVADSFGYE